MPRGRPPSYPAATRAILELRLRPGTRLPGEFALAERLGIHRLTLRKALTDLRRSGLVESRPGKGHFWIGRGGVRHLGLAVHHLPTEGPLPPYVARVVQGVHEGCEDGAFHWVHFESRHAASFLDRTRLDGLAVLSPNFADNARFLGELLARGLPLATINHFHPGIDGAMADHETALAEVLAAMERAGRRRLAFLAHSLRFQDVARRLRLTERFAKEHGMALPKDQVVFGDADPRAVAVWARGLGKAASPDGIVVAHPPMLFELLDAMSERQRDRIGKEILVACLSDHPRLEELCGGVTAVNQPLEAMGAWAARRIHARLSATETEALHETFPCEIRWRATLPKI